jgi:predicted NodU family carbamoyl transferase
VKILSYNPGHDGAIAFLQDGRLIMSVEAEKDSNYRYSPVSSNDVFNALGELDEVPDVICTGGWWPRDHYEYLARVSCSCRLPWCVKEWRHCKPTTLLREANLLLLILS